MEISAELILEINKFRMQTEEAKRRVRSVGEEGRRASRHMSSGLAAIGNSAQAGGGLLARSVGGFRSALLTSFSALGGAGVLFRNMFRWATLLGGALTAAGGAMVAFGTVDALRDAAAYEETALSVGLFAGNLETAKGILAEIGDLADHTQFETAGLEKLAADLLAAGVPVREILADVKRLAAVSKDMESLASLGDAFGKGFAKQRFDLEVINRFLERQINLFPALGQAMGGLDTDGVRQAITQGKVGVAEIRGALQVMANPGGQFFGVAEARSQTLLGLISTLKSNVTSLSRQAFMPAIESAKGFVVELIRKAGELRGKFAEIGKGLAERVDYVLAAFRVLSNQDLGTVVRTGLLLAAKEFVNEIRNFFRTIPFFLQSFFSGNTGMILASNISFAFRDATRAMGLSLKAMVWDLLGSITRWMSGLLGEGYERFTGQAPAGPFLAQNIALADKNATAYRAEAARSVGNALGTLGGIQPKTWGKVFDSVGQFGFWLEQFRNNFPKVFDTAEGQAFFAAIKSSISATMAVIQGEKEARAAQAGSQGASGRNGAGTTADEGEAGGASVAKKTGYTRPGRAAQFVNAIAGRSIYQSIQQTNVQIVQELSRVRQVLQQIQRGGAGDVVVQVAAAGTF